MSPISAHPRSAADTLPAAPSPAHYPIPEKVLRIVLKLLVLVRAGVLFCASMATTKKLKHLARALDQVIESRARLASYLSGHHG